MGGNNYDYRNVLKRVLMAYICQEAAGLGHLGLPGSSLFFGFYPKRHFQGTNPRWGTVKI